MTNLMKITCMVMTALLLACGSSRTMTGDGEETDVGAPDDVLGDGSDVVAPDVADETDVPVDVVVEDTPIFDVPEEDASDVERCWDEGCPCSRGETVACYEGAPGTRNVGPCKDGLRICTDDDVFGECIGQVTPVDEVCDDIDNNCDGRLDEDLLNACGQCGETPEEICGNSLDDDCDGISDESDADCNCDAECRCPDPPDPDAPCECNPPTDQPCYDGPPDTLGMGECVGGLHDCIVEEDGSGHWGPCTGQVTPADECDGGPDGFDNDCDGMADEGCVADNDGDGYTIPEDCDDDDPDINPGEDEVCDGIDNNCNGLADEGVTNACGDCGEVPDEECGNGFDDDCDGDIDENCTCEAGETQACYSGPPDTEGTAHCHAGLMECIAVGEFSHWGPCEGESPPELEVCDGEDNDCDGETDERWAVGSNRCGFCDGTELCDWLDNDCDGFVDEGLRNACGDCLPVPEESLCDGEDDDCDGLVDEGLLNACGLCPPEPCFRESYGDPGECGDPGRECDGTEPWDEDPTSITLGESTLSNPFIYISVTGRNQVAKLDTETGEKIWQVSSHGTSPSRTAVALDYTVWVGNRGFAGVWSPDHSNVVHLDADGSLICRADVTGLVRGVAIDAEGNIWAGTYDGQSLWKIDGNTVDDTVTPPRCPILGTWNVGVNVYGLAVDGRGYVWSSSCPYSVRFHTTAYTEEHITNHVSYGIAISSVDGRVWYGDWGTWPGGCSGGGYVHSIQNVPPFSVFNTSFGDSMITSVTVDREGFVWGSGHNTGRVYKINPTTGNEVCSALVPDPVGCPSHCHGVAEDAAGKIWVSGYCNGYASRFTKDCVEDGVFPVDPGYTLYTYSDMTGMQLRTVTVREGHWYQVYDSGYSCPTWHSVEWTADVPVDTSISVTAVAADTEARLATDPSEPCGPFFDSPGDLLSCDDLQCHRWLLLDLALETKRDGVKPVVHDLSVYWYY